MNPQAQGLNQKDLDWKEIAGKLGGRFRTVRPKTYRCLILINDPLDSISFLEFLVDFLFQLLLKFWLAVLGDHRVKHSTAYPFAPGSTISIILMG